jgi:hypothetical protein
LQEIAESKRSKYRQVSNTSRELDLKSLIRSEINNFATGGYEAPDLTNPEIVTALREWSGASNFVGQFKLASFKDTLGGEITSMPGYVENDNDNDDGDDNDNDNDNDDGGDDDDNAD